MARLSIIPKLSRIPDAAQKWKLSCLMDDGSVLAEGRLWTRANLLELEKHFIKNPLLGAEKFLQKLKRQLQLVGPDPIQLTAELLWLMFLFPSNITGSKKREN